MLNHSVGLYDYNSCLWNQILPWLGRSIASKVLVDEKCDEHHTNAIIVITRSDEPKIIGHLERSCAAAVTKILQLHSIQIHKKSYLHKLVQALVLVLFCCNCTASSICIGQFF